MELSGDEYDWYRISGREQGTSYQSSGDTVGIDKIDVADKPSREKAAADWQRHLVDVQAAEARYRDACKEKFGVEAASAAGIAGGAEEPQGSAAAGR